MAGILYSGERLNHLLTHMGPDGPEIEVTKVTFAARDDYLSRAGEILQGERASKDDSAELLYFESEKGFEAVFISDDGEFIPHKDSSHMFDRCRALEEIQFGKTDFSEASDLSYMFSGCIKLSKIDVFPDTKSAEDTSYMYQKCWELPEIDPKSLSLSSCAFMQGMFKECESLKELDLSKTHTAQLEKVYEAFAGCKGIKEIDVSGLSTGEVQSFYNLFARCQSLTNIKGFQDLNIYSAASLQGLFQDCVSLKKVSFEGMDTGFVTNFASMFEGCRSLTDIDLGNIDTWSAENISHLFFGCNSLKEIDLRNNNFENVKDASYAFAACDELEAIQTEGIRMDNLDRAAGMFAYCPKLKEISLSFLKDARPSTYRNFLAGDTSLKGVNIEDIGQSSARQDMQDIFTLCPNLAFPGAQVYISPTNDRVRIQTQNASLDLPGGYQDLSGPARFRLNGILSDDKTIPFDEYGDTIDSAQIRLVAACKRKRLRIPEEMIAWGSIRAVNEGDEAVLSFFEKLDGKMIQRLLSTGPWTQNDDSFSMFMTAGTVLGLFSDDPQDRQKAAAFIQRIGDETPDDIFIDQKVEIPDFLEEKEPVFSEETKTLALRTDDAALREMASRKAVQAVFNTGEKETYKALTALHIPPVLSKDIFNAPRENALKAFAESVGDLTLPVSRDLQYGQVHVKPINASGKEGAQIREKVRRFLYDHEESVGDTAILTPKTAHDIFSSLNPEFNRDFAAWYMNHHGEILKNPDRQRDISIIQSAWDKIQEARDMNLRHFKNMPPWKMSFTDIDNILKDTNFRLDSGNENLIYKDLLPLCARYGYGQRKIEAIKEIYDKQIRRGTTSIPDVGGTIGNLTYSMLDLNDPAAIFFGQLLNCCQQYQGAGHDCMVHSVNSKNGRVFMVRDDKGKPVAGSWVWRNKGTVCFDNIEDVTRDKTYMQCYEAAAAALAQATDPDDVINKVTAGWGWSDAPIRNYPRDDENRYPIERSDIDYLNDSRTQSVLWKSSEPEKDTPAIYRSNVPFVFDADSVLSGKTLAFNVGEIMRESAMEKVEKDTRTFLRVLKAAGKPKKQEVKRSL